MDQNKLERLEQAIDAAHPVSTPIRPMRRPDEDEDDGSFEIAAAIVALLASEMTGEQVNTVAEWIAYLATQRSRGSARY